jgi:hypothetical protein
MSERSSVVAEGSGNGVGQSLPGSEVGGDVKEALLERGSRAPSKPSPAPGLPSSARKASE